ncbi:carboxypeptidase regulatory-like domain-containing protein [Sphingobacterium spiritivorum]|uniref:carboxypeptidase regulatory-like domain-containing protein n=1 Tax=Sphingobacterium spiritivorum TaxID=258 RepID=UPI0019196489|nr:carboxypeptidase regulatory-like domain-containing protein [Sphingobacterium spiritivorum]QQT25532.1 carboxypeptidase regulatory-like domain-containing protein [Sphingobacterium spiritivorum]
MKAYLTRGLVICILFFFCTGCSEELIEKTVTARVKGIVVKSKTNEPLAKVKITTAPTTQTVFSSADGTFEIPDMPLGDYAVKAELSGFIMEIKGANLITSDQSVSLVFEMKDDKSLNSPPTVPQLLSPVDNAQEIPLNIKLSWNCTDPDSDSLSYRLIIKNNKSEDVRDIKNIKAKTYQLDNLNYGTSYFWQVVVSDSLHTEVFSPVYKFTTSEVPQNRFHFVRKSNNNYSIISTDENNKSFNFTNSNTNSLRARKSNAAGVTAFIQVTDGNAHIFTAKPDGSGVLKVTTVAVAGFNIAELDFAWSANGKEILYPSYDKLYRVNKDGSGTELVYRTPDGSFISECDWSNEGSRIVLKTNDINGYHIAIYVIDMLGNRQQTILENVKGAAGGLNFSVDGKKILYTYDISGYENADYRQLNSHIFVYNLSDNTKTDLSSFTKIPAGYNDLDARFSPNEAEIIFTQTSNDGISQKDIYKIGISSETSRKLLFTNAMMPDWE